MSTLIQDVRYALRGAGRRRVFTAVIVATVALGVGANTAIFSVVHAILLRPLPYAHPERVVSFGHAPPQWLTSAPEYLDYKTGLGSFESLSAYTQGEGNLSSEDEPERIRALLVQQVTARVRWRESMATMTALGVTAVVELGAGKVLTGLAKRGVPGARLINVQEPADVEAAAAALTAEA